MNLRLPGGGGGEWGDSQSKGVWDHHIHIAIFKTDNQQVPYSTRKSAECYVAAWMGREFGGECIHVYV